LSPLNSAQDLEENKPAENSANLENWFFESTYLDKQRKPRKCYEMTKDGFMLLSMGFTGEKALALKIAYIEQFNAMEKALQEKEKSQQLKIKCRNFFLINHSELNQATKKPSYRRSDFKMQEPNLDRLKTYLPQYVERYTQKRRGNFYNCPFCGSGTGKNKTPAFNLYENGTKFKCQSCGVQGTIIDFYLMIHHLDNSKENVAQAITELTNEFEPAVSATKTKIDERQHIYKNSDGSIFGKKVINKFSDGSKSAFWLLFDPKIGRFSDKYGLNGQKAPLYNADLLKNNADKPVYIVEGEKDADTLTNWGLISTTCPNGAGFANWIPLYNEGLQNHDVIILTDNDDSGRKYGNTIAKNVISTAKSVKIVRAEQIWDQCSEKGDISDIRQALGDQKAQELLEIAVKNTDFYCETAENTEIKYHFVKASDVKETQIEFAWFPYLPIGELSIMYASGGTGKSFLTCGIASDISAGRSLPQPNEEQTAVEPANVLFISAEDSQSTLKQRLLTANADLSRCFIFAPPDSKEELKKYIPFELPFDKDDTERISALKLLLSETKPKLVIIDPWSAYVGQKTDMNRANSVRAMTSVLTVIAKEYRCSILIVAHVNKKLQTENVNDAVSGSADLVNGARSAIAVRTFGDSGHRIMVHTKANYSELGKSLCYEIVNQGRNKPAVFKWGEFSSITADDLISSARSGKKLTDIADDKHDDEEDKAVALAVIKKLAVFGKEIPISYERFRKELENECGVDFLPKRPAKFVNSLISDLHCCGISIELKSGIRDISDNGECDHTSRKGFVICYMTNGNLMADAMPKKQ